MGHRRSRLRGTLRAGSRPPPVDLVLQLPDRGKKLAWDGWAMGHPPIVRATAVTKQDLMVKNQSRKRRELARRGRADVARAGYGFAPDAMQASAACLPHAAPNSSTVAGWAAKEVNCEAEMLLALSRKQFLNADEKRELPSCCSMGAMKRARSLASMPGAERHCSPSRIPSCCPIELAAGAPPVA